MAKLAEHRRVVISGLPGTGKSELACQILDKARDSGTYKGFFWLSAASEANIQAGIYEMARELKLLADSHMDIENIRRIVLNELSKQDHWLMILDNVDDIDLIKDFMPSRRGIRHVLITTRYRDAHLQQAINGNSVELIDMTQDEATLLFKEYSDENQENTDGNEISSLVEMLGFLPLAIIQQLHIYGKVREPF